MMTSKERLFRALRREKYDRIPIWTLMNKIQKFTHHVNPYEHDSYKGLIKLVKDKTDSLERLNICNGIGSDIFIDGIPRLFSSDSNVINVKEKKHNSKNGNLHKEIGIESNSGVLKYSWMIRKGYSIKQKTEYMIKNLNDIDKILSLPYKPYKLDLNNFFKLKRDLGNLGVPLIGISNPLESVCDLIPMDKFYLWLKTDLKKILQLFELFYERLLIYIRYLLENGVGPCFWIGGSEYCGPPHTSVDLWKKLVFQYDKKIIDLIHRFGCLVVYHHHGWLKDLLNLIIGMKPDALHPVEDPPYGNITIKEVRSRIGSEICLIGNIQYDDIFNSSQDDIESKVKRVIEDTGHNGNFILALTAGPYIYPLPEKAFKNYVSFIEAGLKYGSIS